MFAELRSVDVDDPGALEDIPLAVVPFVCVVVELTTKLANALVSNEVEAPAAC